MKIVIGCDHAALTLKDAVKAHLLELGHEVKDFGIYQAGDSGKVTLPRKGRRGGPLSAGRKRRERNSHLRYRRGDVHRRQ